MFKSAYLFAFLLALTASQVQAKPSPHAPTSEADSSAQPLTTLRPLDGIVEIPKAHATLRLKPGYRFLSAADARTVLEKEWGNPADDTVLGMIVPSDDMGFLGRDEGWGVVVTYSDDGHVSDEDAKDTDYAKLLKDMQEASRAGNKERRKAGYPAITLVGWAQQPYYSATGRQLYWARELASEDHLNSRYLNYDVRMLSRSGYLSLNAIASMDQLPAVRTGMKDVLSMAAFDPGYRYADFNSSTDRVAEYGVAALIAGVAAKKLGLIAIIAAFAVKFFKVGLVAVLAFGAALKRFFRRKPKPVTPTDAGGSPAPQAAEPTLSGQATSDELPATTSGNSDRQ
jgi:uncharacterized membrane-anchored protein